MYVKFPPGNAFPGGYIAPCEVKQYIPQNSPKPFGAYVTLSDQAGTVEWTQYVRIQQLIPDEEVE